MKQYTVFYTDANGIEQSLPITATDRFEAKVIAAKEHNIPLQTITRVL